DVGLGQIVRDHLVLLGAQIAKENGLLVVHLIVDADWHLPVILRHRAIGEIRSASILRRGKEGGEFESYRTDAGLGKLVGLAADGGERRRERHVLALARRRGKYAEISGLHGCCGNKGGGGSRGL